MSEDILGNAEIGIRQLALSIERGMEVAIAGGKRRQVMIQEVKRGKTELEALPLADLEVLHQRKVALPERRTRQVRHPTRPEAPVCGRGRKAGRVEVFVGRRQAFLGVAGDRRLQGEIRGPQQMDIVVIGQSRGGRTHRLGQVGLRVIQVPGLGGFISAALEGGDA